MTNNENIRHRSQILRMFYENRYSHLSNSRGGWNKRGGGAKVTKSINVGGWNKCVGWDFLEKTST